VNRSLLYRLAAVIGLAALFWLGHASSSGTGNASAPPEAKAAIATAHPEVGFHDRERLAEHYHKHGAEFGEISEAQYLLLAQRLRDRPAGGEVREAVRADGVVTRYDRQSGAFLAFDPDLTIRTFFRPNDGEAYFERQLKRRHGEP